jgi:hypothetical protein
LGEWKSNVISSFSLFQIRYCFPEYTYKKYNCAPAPVGKDIGRDAVRAKVHDSLNNLLRNMK